MTLGLRGRSGPGYVRRDARKLHISENPSSYGSTAVKVARPRHLYTSIPYNQKCPLRMRY
jgi:hypothetical protein